MTYQTPLKIKLFIENETSAGVFLPPTYNLQQCGD
jgi:hypothetical protein